ncbi:hypothetical protein [Mesorhizobium sp.]|uniref:hypothetical protein n=1 Tax=Mesorhizobium sp. TaxID=1871066 RepID=UPI0025DE444B|nr:hypothetical protein [Mesorhizobium sp.]
MRKPIAIAVLLRAISLMAADELDAVVFQMAVESVRALPISFTEKAEKIATMSRGALLFDVRIDGDAAIQRVAAIRYPSDQTGVLALEKQGLVTRHCLINGAFSSFIGPLEAWTSQPLSTQAKTDIVGHASLFIGALRNAGYMRLS